MKSIITRSVGRIPEEMQNMPLVNTKMALIQ